MSINRNTTKMLCINQSTSENPNTFWSNCSDFLNIDSDTPSLEHEGFVYADTQMKSPNIVGVAIKRSLKVNDELEYLDSIQKTIQNSAPTAEVEETEEVALDEEIEQIYLNNKQQNIEMDIIDTETKSNVAPLNDLFFNKLKENDALIENVSTRINEQSFATTINMLNDTLNDNNDELSIATYVADAPSLCQGAFSDEQCNISDQKNSVIESDHQRQFAELSPSCQRLAEKNNGKLILIK